MRFRLAVLLIGVVTNVFATSPRNAHIYYNYSQNNAYYFKSTPYSWYPKELGKTVIYETKTGRIIDSIGQYMYWNAFISNDGMSIFHVVPYASKDNYNSWPIVDVFRKSKMHRFYIKDLISDSTKLNRGWSRTSWLRNSWLQNDTLFILTRYETSTLVDKEMKAHFVSTTELENRFKTSIPKDKSTWGGIVKMPFHDRRGLTFAPPLRTNGKDFHSGLMEILQMKTVDNWDKALYNLRLELLIDKTGKAELYSFNLVDKREQTAKPLLRTRIEHWVDTLSFKTEEIPETVEKWLFDYYAYLVD